MTQRILTEEEFYGLYTRKEIKDSRYYDRQKNAHHVTENMRIDKELSCELEDIKITPN